MNGVKIMKCQNMKLEKIETGLFEPHYVVALIFFCCINLFYIYSGLYSAYNLIFLKGKHLKGNLSTT